MRLLKIPIKKRFLEGKAKSEISHQIKKLIPKKMIIPEVELGRK